MRILSRDAELFHSRYYDAAVFVVASEIRFECYMIACNAKHASLWQVKRLEELLQSPACREAWFVVMLRNDCKSDIEDFLVAAGL